MGGFIVLQDGRAYVAANWATDATVRAIAAEVADPALRKWLLAQQSEFVGMGMTCIDLREIAPRHRPVLHAAIRGAYARVRRGGFEQLDQSNEATVGWLKRFSKLVEMVDRCEAGEPPGSYKPHLTGLIPASGDRIGPGWDAPPADHRA